MLRGQAKRKSWISRTVTDPEQRHHTTLALKELRQTYPHQSGYYMARGLENLKLNFNFDATKYIKGMMREQKKGVRNPLVVLDSGAGLLKLSGELKGMFGKKIALTALTLRGPITSKKTLSEMKNARETRLNFEAMQEFRAHKRYPKAAKLVDELRISTLEDLETTKKYDMILDIHGPLTYPLVNESRILEQYLHFLRPGGVLVTTRNPPAWEKFPPASEYAARIGYGFIRKKIPGTTLFSMTKTRKATKK